MTSTEPPAETPPAETPPAQPPAAPAPAEKPSAESIEEKVKSGQPLTAEERNAADPEDLRTHVHDVGGPRQYGEGGSKADEPGEPGAAHPEGGGHGGAAGASPPPESPPA